MVAGEIPDAGVPERRSAQDARGPREGVGRRDSRAGRAGSVWGAFRSGGSASSHGAGAAPLPPPKKKAAGAGV